MSGYTELDSEAFVEAVRKTFSEMAFIDVNPSEKPEPAPGISQVTQIEILEPVHEEILLYMPYECKKKIVENVYGEDWDNLAPDQIDDCLLELLNILVGNYLSDTHGDDTGRDISLPRLLFDENGHTGSGAAKYFYFDAEGCPFKAAMVHSPSP